MEQYIPKSVVLAEIERLIKKNELYLDDNVSDAVRFQKTGAYSVLCDLRHFLDTLEVKGVDLEKERIGECPYRRVECTMYDDSIFECKGACSWVVDYLKLKGLKVQKGE